MYSRCRFSQFLSAAAFAHLTFAATPASAQAPAQADASAQHQHEHAGAPEQESRRNFPASVCPLDVQGIVKASLGTLLGGR